MHTDAYVSSAKKEHVCRDPADQFHFLSSSPRDSCAVGLFFGWLEGQDHCPNMSEYIIFVKYILNITVYSITVLPLFYLPQDGYVGCSSAVLR
jgi:hypothetical protein